MEATSFVAQPPYRVALTQQRDVPTDKCNVKAHPKHASKALIPTEKHSSVSLSIMWLRLNDTSNQHWNVFWKFGMEEQRPILVKISKLEEE